MSELENRPDYLQRFSEWRLKSSSIVQSAAGQQGPQEPHKLQNVVDLSGRREKQGASRKCGSSNGYAMAPLLGDYRFGFLFYSWKADRNNLMFSVCRKFVIIN